MKKTARKEDRAEFRQVYDPAEHARCQSTRPRNPHKNQTNMPRAAMEDPDGSDPPPPPPGVPPTPRPLQDGFRVSSVALFCKIVIQLR
jgi:hypothetical protein